jgi:hypothetical protein
MSLMSLLSTGILLAAAAAQPATTHFSSPRGFSLDYPQGWVVGTRETQQALLSQYKSVFEKMGKVDLSRMAVMVFDPCDDEFIENISVVISSGRVPVTEESCRKLAQELPAQMQGAGLSVTDVRTELVVFGNRNVISNRYLLTGLRPGLTLRQWQILVPGANRTYIVTASATQATFPRYEARFRDIFGSFQADSGVLGLWYGIPNIIRYAIIGGIVGGLAGGIRALFKRKPPQADGTKTLQAGEGEQRGEVR